MKPKVRPNNRVIEVPNGGKNKGAKAIREAALTVLSKMTRGQREGITFHLPLIEDKTHGRYLFSIWHRECDELAFFMTEDPRYTTIKSSNSVNPDNGEHYEPHSPVICYSCGKPMRPCDTLLLPPERTKTILTPGQALATMIGGIA